MEFEQGCDAQTELLLLESNEVKDSEEDAVVLEARMIATRIHEMTFAKAGIICSYFVVFAFCADN